MNNSTELVILSNAISQIGGLYSLNDLHKASGAQKKDTPSRFIKLDKTTALINQIEQDPKKGFAMKMVHGGDSAGTYGCKQLVIAYAAWISPEVNLAVIDAFLEKHDAPVAIEFTRLQLIEMALESEKELEKVKCEVIELKPKAEFHDRVAVAEDCISISKAAKTLGTGRNRLMTDLRRIKWVSKRNEPYQDKIEQGLMDVKLGSFQHPDHGLTQSITPLITGKGLTTLSLIIGGAS